MIKTEYDLLKYYQGIADYLDYPIKSVSSNKSLSLINFNEENISEEKILLNEEEHIHMMLTIEKK